MPSHFQKVGAMPYRTCHACQRPGRLLESSSTTAFVDYYRCDHCGHVWALDKQNPDAPPRDITLPPKNTKIA